MEEWKYGIALKMVHGAGEVLFRNLLSKFYSALNTFKAQINEIGKEDGIGEKTAQAIKGFSDWGKAEEEAEKVKRSAFKLQKKACGSSCSLDRRGKRLEKALVFLFLCHIFSPVKLVKTVKCKLEVPIETKPVLHDALLKFAQACNDILQISIEHKTSNKVKTSTFATGR